ncbi:hypothetical protein F2Q69_00050996 [Brassica cretica]|uniref:CDP-diacylglycerol--inositol 3-phosphatidyltransferase n=1 Tax=Brassica cretica TaxID=69181 RepID=A0A8S9PYI5_BRACR|nr:hypothetical protein F2Q69_00050996 [Brassica cretica]
MDKKERGRPEKLSVYLYIPNIVGYMRVVSNCVAFVLLCVSPTKHSSPSFISSAFVVMLWMAGALVYLTKPRLAITVIICTRKLELDSFLLLSSSVSTFGAVLDMVTDRVSTACLLVILSQVYRPSLVFLSLLALDIASHWLQMYSHKDVKDSTSWLFRLYYGNRIFMCYCCVSCEVLYIILLLIANNQTENLLNVVVATLTHIITTLFSTGFDFVGLVDETGRQYHSDENSFRCMCSV